MRGTEKKIKGEINEEGTRSRKLEETEKRSCDRQKNRRERLHRREKIRESMRGRIKEREIEGERKNDERDREINLER